MIELLKRLCLIDSPSGSEKAVRDFIIDEIKDFCEYKIDNLGNIIAFKKGKSTPSKKVMLDAHMDEVGLIITSVTDSGFLKFKTLGGISADALIARRVLINGDIYGVIGIKPIHLSKGDEAKKLPKADSLYIDIGASSKENALEKISRGDTAVICGEFSVCDNNIMAKALDDRIGCAVLIDLIKGYNEYDFYATFTVQEELGCRGARVAAFGVEPECAIILEGTTAADISGVKAENQVCSLGNGVAVSFMDGGTVYDRDIYNAALNSKIKCQPKAATTGGNNASAVHLSKSGVRTIALSAPCRYIHTACSVANICDIENMKDLTRHLLTKLCIGEL